ncbi:unnamed protein product [Effrenium voratum]|uniref:Uncharacterized protein n=1 Tax=Effrenium voratum TaxID=2562239 RepID=A0AA36I4H6_9DINO|nr:unnamed protein product [Effrenium voratum]
MCGRRWLQNCRLTPTHPAHARAWLCSCLREDQLTEKQKLEAKMTNQTRLLQTSEHHAMRIAVEKVTGKLRDKEASSKQLISVRLEQVPQAEDLKEVTSLDEGEIESLAATIDPASATLRIRSGKKTVATPKNAEELRLRHRRIGFSWQFVATFRIFPDWIMGAQVAGPEI